MDSASVVRNPHASMNEASIPNRALEPLTPLVGEWETVGTHPMVPGTTRGSAIRLTHTRVG